MTYLMIVVLCLSWECFCTTLKFALIRLFLSMRSIMGLQVPFIWESLFTSITNKRLLSATSNLMVNLLWVLNKSPVAIRKLALKWLLNQMSHLMGLEMGSAKKRFLALRTSERSITFFMYFPMVVETLNIVKSLSTV
jgi:hypothetical protein